MMKVNPAIEEAIKAAVLADYEEREPSGRISAGRLGWPLQWQILHTLKVQPKPFDEFTLRKFVRGNDVEDRVMKWLNLAPNQMQVATAYRGIVGFADIVLDYPIDIKSVTNRAFGYIQKEGSKLGHRLQTECYAKGLGYDKYGIAYVASDDYRVLCFEHEVTNECDEVIDEYEAQMATGEVPVFKARETWQESLKYNNYPEWMKLTQEEIDAKLAAMGIRFTKSLNFDS
jgi:hypothetical protein